MPVLANAGPDCVPCGLPKNAFVHSKTKRTNVLVYESKFGCKIKIGNLYIIFCIVLIERLVEHSI